MARRIIDIGAVGNDGTGDSIRDSFRKVNDNFRELYSSLGLGERLKFTGLDDTPESYVGQNDPDTGSTPLVTVNNTESGLAFKRLNPGNGISIDFTTNPNEITVNADFAEIAADTTPQLGGNLSARSGGEQYRILDLGTSTTPLQPIFSHEAVNKAYADSKIARAGVNAIDPATGNVDSSFGRMSGPLILSRDPEPEDDELYGGLVAATKRYVDNSAFGSTVNLYVALSGEDERPGVSKSLQGRALAYAYRTLEAALKRAEELVLESREEIGPYKKTLTFNNGAQECTLTSITASPSSGSGFIGSVRMSVDTLRLNSIGTNYYPGDRLTLTGGTIASGGGACIVEVLSTLTTPGAIVTFRIISSGSYSVLPGATGVGAAITTSGAPGGIGSIGAGATFNITYKVNSVAIVNGGTGYSLVSVRVIGGGGAGAFGTAVVSSGAVSSITITDQGSGFTSIPTLTVDLPRFAIRTDFFRTDFTGDVLTDTPQAIRGRDIREGLYLRGETSGALGQILAHSGELDSNGNELFDMDIKFGTFEIGEVISYGDVTKSTQISILVESGEYYENYPLKVSQNVTIIGDDFRRVIFRPKLGTSSSPWAFQKFRRDPVIDSLRVADRPYGYHYLQDSSEPVYPKINNKGDYDSAAALIDLNRQFIQEEIIAWMDNNIATALPATTWYNFDYNENLCKRDAGLLVDAFVFDLKYGEYNRTISAGLKYYESTSARIAITTQLAQYRLVLDKLNELMQSIILNATIDPVYQDLYPQIIDPAFQAEVGSGAVITELVIALEDVIDGSGSVNYPKDNNQMDVFLANDAVRWQSISSQGHGGFMLVLDPTGQVLAKSPYAQECSSFSRSIDRPIFAGGKFVDGFAGNLQWKHTATDVTNTRLTVSNLYRFPNLPASFLVDDSVFRINYVRDFVYSPEGSTATFILDETTPYDRPAGAQTCTISNGNPVVITRTDHRLQSGATIEFSVSSGGSLPDGLIAGREYFVVADGLSNNTFNISATYGSIVKVATTSAGSGTFAYQRTYELLMPGNRSMLSNDFTQINDLGYGLVATNGGLIEAVSMFTYYCHISYYSLNGGQIRSVGGSSAHGNYALVAEGADPLEVPTPTSIYEELSQRAKCYFPSPTYANTLNGLFIYVYAYEYTPLGGSELEVDHGGAIYRYPVNTVTTTDLPAGVARLNLGSAEEAADDGLFAQVPNNTVLTIRANGQILLTGDLAEVAVRPSTGLKLRETDQNVYRVLQFSSYPDSNAPYKISVSQTNPAIFKILTTVITIDTNLCTTISNHKLRPGDKFIPTSTANGFTSGTTYYVIEIPEYNQFKVSLTPDGTEETLTNGTGLYIQGAKTHKLLENYTLQLTTPVLEDVEITGTSGQFSCSPTTLISGQTITISGINSNTGSIVGYVSPTTYFIITTNGTTTFTLSATSGGPAITTTAGTPVGLTFSGVFPAPLTADDQIYYVRPQGLTDTEFTVSTLRNGNAVAVTGDGTGTFGYTLFGLTRTVTRENYNYNDLTLFQPGEFTSDYPTGRVCTVSVGSPADISLASHGFVAGDVVKFETTGSLPTGITTNNNFHVLSAGLVPGVSFRVSLIPGGDPVDTSGTQFGTHTVGQVTGLAGDTTFAVVPVAAQERSRVAGSKFVFLGEEYIIEEYQSEEITNTFFARLVLNRPLVNSIISYQNAYTVKSAIAVRTNGSIGTLTIRISLTRVTSHDLLEIGTGSYADTNYPSEIYGPPVNAVNDSNETEERDVGRVFYVTTDQFGNFSVGPYFRVDQGTGTVTFAASIALSNLDGIGFKRGVPVSEFSTDSGFTDNATDTVPTENAARIYIERRLGLTHDGAIVPPAQLIPTVSGGYMALDGKLGMKAAMNLNNNKIVNLTNATEAQDAVNLRSLTFDNFQEMTITAPESADILTFTGAGTAMINASIGGDLSASLIYSISTTLTGAFYDDSSVTEIDSGIEDESNIQVSDGIVVASYASFPDSGYIKINNEILYYAAKVLGAGPGAPTANRLTGILRAQLGSTATSHAAGSAVSSLSNVTHDLQIVSGSIINTDVKSDAAIAQSKLAMTAATTRANATGIVQADRGLASFDDSQFTATNGWISLKSNGTVITRLEQIATKTVLGNSTLGTANVAQVAFSTVVNDGGGIKKTQYASTGFLRRISGTSLTADADYAIIEAAAGTAASPEAGRLIIRDSNGDFGARVADLSQIKLDNKVSIDTETTATGGFIRYYGWDTAGGILVSNGSLAEDRKTAYWNDSHDFRTQNGVSLAPITASSIQVTAITTGGNTTAGTISGRWTLTGTSPNESRLQATYSADLAEYYEGDKDYPVGTVLVFGGDKEVTISSKHRDTRVAGVVSNTAAFVMYDACPGFKNLVALQGRVPCRVVGKIKKGDLLVTSNIPGVAISAQETAQVGTVVGKALVNYDSDHIGTIEIAVGRT
jgi:hypothetical protein